MASRSDITLQREDISKFVVHLTRDDTKDFGEDGSSGRENLTSILDQRTIRAFRPHCLHKKLLPDGMPKSVRAKFNVACFTEVPLHQIHLLTQPIEGVAYQREPYGIVFDRQALIAAGAQPAIYVNSYAGNTAVKEAYDEIFRRSLEAGWAGEMWKVLPFVNAMHERYDFTWEREWRTNRRFDFRLKDVVAIILPSSGEEEVQETATQLGIPCISPGWTYEMIVRQLSRQQRGTRRAVKKELESPD